MSDGTLLYLYGIADAGAPAPPDALRGLEDGRVRLVAVDDLAAIVSDVPAGEYGEAELDAHLADVQWVGERGVAHERVLTWYLDQGAVLPFSPFSLHAGEEALQGRLRQRHQDLAATLARLRNHREWMIRVWRDEERFATSIAGQSDAIRAIEGEMTQAGEGKRFLLERKRDTIRTEEARRISAQHARSAFEALAELATQSAAIPIPPSPSRSRRALIMQGAFLVFDADYAAFEQRVQELAADHRERGFDWEFTGPWPAYHFAAPPRHE